MNDINEIRRDYGICSKAISFTELERYHYERNDPKSEQVRLIVKVELSDNEPIVIRFKNETDVTLEVIEKQSQFAALLGENGIETPALYKTGSHYAKWYSINGYDVIVTVERFVKGEISCVDTDTPGKPGGFLQKRTTLQRTQTFMWKTIYYLTLLWTMTSLYSQNSKNMRAIFWLLTPLYMKESLKNMKPICKS